MLECGADPNPNFPDGRYPLAYVIDENYPNSTKFVRALLDYKASVYTNYPKPSVSKTGVLMWVITHNSLSENVKNKLVRIFLAHGAYSGERVEQGGYSIHYHDIQGWTPLFAALERGYTEIVEMILRNKLGLSLNEPKLYLDGRQYYISPRYIPWIGKGLSDTKQQSLLNLLERYGIKQQVIYSSD